MGSGSQVSGIKPQAADDFVFLEIADCDLKCYTK